MTWSQWRSDLREWYMHYRTFRGSTYAPRNGEQFVDGYYAYALFCPHGTVGHSTRWHKGHHNDAWQRLVRLRHFNYAVREYERIAHIHGLLPLRYVQRLLRYWEVQDKLTGTYRA